MDLIDFIKEKKKAEINRRKNCIAYILLMQISWSLEPILFSFYFRTRLIIHFLSKIFPFHYDWSRYIVWNGAMLVLALGW